MSASAPPPPPPPPPPPAAWSFCCFSFKAAAIAKVAHSATTPLPAHAAAAAAAAAAADDDDDHGDGDGDSASDAGPVISPANSSLYTITSPASPFSLNVPLRSNACSYSSSSAAASAASHGASSLFLIDNLLFAASSSSPHISVSSSSSLAPLLRHRFSSSSSSSSSAAAAAWFSPRPSPISAITASPAFVITAHLDRRIRVWRRPPAHALPPDTDRPRRPTSSSAAASPAAASSSPWAQQKRKSRASAATYELVGTLPSATDYVRNAISAMATATAGGEARMGISRYRRRRRRRMEHADAITCLAVEADGSLLYSGSWDKTLKVWSMRRMRCVQSIDPAHDDAVNGMALAAAAAAGDGGGDGGAAHNMLYTVSADRTMKGWRKVGAERRVLMWTLRDAHAAAVNAVATMMMIGGGAALFTAGSDCKINVWRALRRRRRRAHLDPPPPHHHHRRHHPPPPPPPPPHHHHHHQQQQQQQPPRNDVRRRSSNYSYAAADPAYHDSGHDVDAIDDDTIDDTIDDAHSNRCSMSHILNNNNNNNNNNVVNRRCSSTAAAAAMAAPWHRWKELRGHRQAVLCLAAAGPLLCSGSADKTIRLWKMITSAGYGGSGGGSGGGSTNTYVACMAVLEGHAGPVRSLCVRNLEPTRRCIVNSAAADGSIRVWSVFLQLGDSVDDEADEDAAAAAIQQQQQHHRSRGSG